MKLLINVLPKAAGAFLIFSVICGILYTAAVTGLAQLLFPHQANGSIIEADGKKYGSVLLGQQFTGEEYMWGRIMNVEAAAFRDKEGNALMYAYPSNLSPAGEEYEKLVAERVERLRKANPQMDDKAVPVDLVTCSGSGLDPGISVAAARYQIPRIAHLRKISEEKAEEIVKACTQEKFLGIFGEDTVNVLQVNLMLDGILEK